MVMKKILCCVLIGVTLNLVGCNSVEIESLNKKVEDLNSQLKKQTDYAHELEAKVVNLNLEKEELQSKVDEAKPWFDMAEEERKVEEEKLAEEKAKKEAEEKAKTEAERLAELEAKTVTLSSGNFIAGEDFPEGVYTITAISGGGNVHSDNAYNGGINAIMGVENNGFYELEYKNIKLPSGTTLTLSGVEVKLTPKE